MTAYDDGRVSVHLGDCLDVLRSLPDASVDAVVTDPPYDLTANKRGGSGTASVNLDSPYGRSRIGTGNGSGGFMGKEWDSTGIAFRPEVWIECLRVLKPGGHMLAFGGTRTWHRLACAVEDAGFEVRDSLAWIYGSGFPKSLNASKALLDKRCQCSEVESEHGESATEHAMRALSDADVSQAVRVDGGSRSVLLSGVPEQGAPDAGRAELPAIEVRPGQPSLEGRGNTQEAARKLQGREVRPLPGGVPEHGEGGRLHHGAPSSHGSVDRALYATDRSGEPQGPRPVEQRTGEPGVVPEQRGSQAWGGWTVCARCGKPSIPDGLGTALKPAFEPVVVARKPLQGAVAQSVLTHGTGALNIDACRITASGQSPEPPTSQGSAGSSPADSTSCTCPGGSPSGRWPANVVLDESQAAALDEQSGESASKSGGVSSAGENGGWQDQKGRHTPGRVVPRTGHDDRGGASRFFPTFRYVAKAPATERPRVNGTAHPTVKPLDLMRWLVRLVTPPGGVVLEPFAGSGTTVEACIVEGFRCIAIEREADYLPLILQRIHRRRDPVAAIRQTGDDLGLFELDGEPA